MVQATSYASVGGLLIFGTISSILSKIGERFSQTSTLLLRCHSLDNHPVCKVQHASTHQSIASITCLLQSCLVDGAACCLRTCAVYQTQGEDFDGHAKYFKKPWASTALMFFAMVFCLPIAWIASAVERSRKRRAAGSGEHEPLLDDHHDDKGEGPCALPSDSS